MRLFGRSDLMRRARATVSLEAGERPLAAASLADDGYLVATRRALYAPAAGGGHTSTRWDAMRGATWNRDESRLRVTLTEGGDALVFDLADPGRVPEVVRERIMATIAVNQHIKLAGKHGVRVVARRTGESARSGTGLYLAGAAKRTNERLRWELHYDPQLDPDNDPALRAAAEGELTRIRHEVEG